MQTAADTFARTGLRSKASARTNKQKLMFARAAANGKRDSERSANGGRLSAALHSTAQHAM
eukprot:279795-Lingulodinium_polyedra.AAC.1